MKKKYIVFTLMIIAFCSCSETPSFDFNNPNDPANPLTVTSVSLNKTSTSILISGTETLTATIAPSGAANQNVTWSSSNDGIATVSSTGVVTGVSEGTATITVKTADGEKIASCLITVSILSVSVTAVSLNKTSTSIIIGGTETLTATISPSSATNQNLTWSSSNVGIATVSSGGVITGVSSGTATITVTTADGEKIAGCTVTISDAPVAVTGVSLNKTSISILINSTETLIATIAPSGATNKNVTWSSSNDVIATVSSAGVVTGVSAGTATITVTTVDGEKIFSCTVIVKTEKYILPTSEATSITGCSGVFYLDGNRAYITTPNTGMSQLKVYNMTDPLNPVLLGSYSHGFSTPPLTIPGAVTSNVVWLMRSTSGGYGIATYLSGFDVSDPANIVPRGTLTFQTSSSLLHPMGGLEYNGYWLFHDYSRNIMYIVNLSNPDSPTIAYQFSLPNMVNSGPGGALIDGNYLYINCGENKTFRIFNLTNLASVTEVGVLTIAGPELLCPVVKIGNYCYITNHAASTTSLYTIDVSNPTSPTLINTYVISNGYVSLMLKNGQLFGYTLYSNQVYAFSLANPAAPVIEATSTVAIPSPSTSMNFSQWRYYHTGWIGDYFIGGTGTSDAANDGIGVFYFPVY